MLLKKLANSYNFGHSTPKNITLFLCALSALKKASVLINQILETNDDFLLPKAFSLYYVFPIPFNPVTTLEFSVPRNDADQVRIFIYDITGRIVIQLIDQIYDAGHYGLTWDGSALSSGIYFIDFQAGNTRQVRKVSLVK